MKVGYIVQNGIAMLFQIEVYWSGMCNVCNLCSIQGLLGLLKEKLKGALHIVCDVLKSVCYVHKCTMHVKFITLLHKYLCMRHTKYLCIFMHAAYKIYIYATVICCFIGALLIGAFFLVNMETVRVI